MYLKIVGWVANSVALNHPYSICHKIWINPSYHLCLCDEIKDKFYDYLDSVISAAPRTDKLILLGDFNARVGTDHQTWEGVIGSEGVGKCNSNGLLLLRKYAEHDHQHNLPSTNSQKDIMDAPSLQTLALTTS